MPPASGLPRELRTDRRVRADLAEASLPGSVTTRGNVAERLVYGRKTKPRLRSPRAATPSRRSPINFQFAFGKVVENDKYGTGSLVAREEPAALERRRRRLHKLVRANGPRKRPAGKRPPFGSDAISQELDPGA